MAPRLWIWGVTLGLVLLLGRSLPVHAELTPRPLAQPDPDCAVEKFLDDPDPVPGNGTVEFQVLMRNYSPDPGSNVTLYISDDNQVFTHVGYTLDPAAPPGSTCAYNSAAFRLECSFPTLPGNASFWVTWTVRAPSTPGTYDSTATTVCSPDQQPGNNTENNRTTVIRGVDLVLSKGVASATVPAGSIVTFDITVTNNGPGDALTGLILTDTLDSGLTFVADDADPPADDDALWTCTASGQDITCTFTGTLPAGASTIFHYRARVDAPAPITLSNLARVDVGNPLQEGDPDTTNNEASVTLTIQPGTDVRIDKQLLSGSPLVGGQSATFRLVIENLGPMDTSSLTVVDTFPAGYQIDPASITAPPGWTCTVTDSGGAAPTVTCQSNGTNLPAGASVNIDIPVLPPDPNNVETHTNQASVTVNDLPDPVTTNNTTTLTYDVYPNKPDLSVTKSAEPSPVAQGYPITITLTVTNQGAVDATPVVVQDALDPGETVDPASLPTGTPWDCTYDSVNHAVVCTYTDNGGILAAGASSTVSYTVTATGSGTLQNTACVEVNQTGRPQDYDSTNDCASASVLSTTAHADLVVQKTVDDTHLTDAEDTLTFTITITNNGPDDSGQVSFADDVPFYVPAGPGGRPATTITVTSVTGGGTCNVSGGTVACTWANIPAGTTVNVTYTVTRPMRDGTSIVNDVCAYSTEVGDPNRDNNCAAAPGVQVDPVTDIELVSKTLSDNPALAGTETTYTIEVRNNGPSTAVNVQLTDTFTPTPSGATFTLINLSASHGGSCSWTAPTLTCTWPTLDAGTTATVTMTIRPDHIEPPPSPWTFVNQASVTTDTTESNGGNNGPVSVTLNVEPAQLDVVLEKNESPNFSEPVWYDPASSNNLLVYELVLYNYGPSVATQIRIEDRVNRVIPLQTPNQQLEFLYDTANSDGTDDAIDWCTPPTPNPFAINDVTDTNEPLIVCNAPADVVLEPGQTLKRYLVFRVLNAPDPISGDVYENEARLIVYETPQELFTANNEEDESTTVRTIVDLQLTKSAPSTPVEIFTPFTMTLTIHNAGPGIAVDTLLTDSLPAGMELTGTPTTTQGTCTGVSGDTSFTCDLGNLNNGATVTVTVPVQVTDPNTTSYTNTATVSTVAPDTNPDNNTASATVTMNPPVRLGDRVWYDQNQNGLQDPGEPGLAGVDVTLYASPDCTPGTEYTNPLVPSTITTDASGNYTFYPLPHGVYCLQFTNVPLTGYQVSPQDQGVDDTADSDADPTTQEIPNIDLTNPALTQDLTRDMGVFVQGTIGDRVWCESPQNVNATLDLADGDTGTNLVTVELYADFNCDGVPDSATPLQTTVTAVGGTPNTAGYYQFTGLEVALAGSSNQTCYVVQVDTSDPDLGSCNLPDIPNDAEWNVTENPALRLDTNTPATQDVDFAFRLGDFGDLPESGSGTFPTTRANNGAYHLLNEALFLGACADADSDGLADDADAGMVDGGDDGTGPAGGQIGTCTGPDDEDGIQFITPLIPGQQACITVTATNALPQTAYLYGWADWNGDGQFSASEQLTGADFAGGAAAIPPGGVNAQRFCFEVPGTASFENGDIHFRFRLTTDTLTADAFTAAATNGEVEDYWLPLLCIGNLLWDDGIPPVNSLQDPGESGIAGIPVRLVYAGDDDIIDTLAQDATAQNDDVIVATTTTDASGRYAFCGLAPPSEPGEQFVFQVQVPPYVGLKSVAKDAGTDDALDSDASPPNTLEAGWVADTFTLAPAFTPLQAPAYMTVNGSPPPTGEAGLGDADSESLDPGYPDERTDWTYDFGFIRYRDFGDLPNSGSGNFNTTLAQNGPWHAATPALYLGSCVDVEPDGQPDDPDAGVQSGGDDGSPGFDTFGTCATPGDDEDGITLTTPLLPGAEACLSVTARNETGQTAYLYAWFDWNGNGVFEASERLDTGDFAGGAFAFTANLNNRELCFQVPSTATFDGGELHMRFRLTTDATLTSPDGGAPDGEVEDYWLPLACVGNLVWNDSTGAQQDIQDAGDAGVPNLTVRLVWAGADATVDTQATDALPQNDDRVYTTTTDASGLYAFCGLTPGTYQVQIPTPPGTLPQAVAPNQGSDDQRDSDGLQATAGAAVVGPVFTITDVTALPTNESGNQDTGAAGYANNFPDNQVDETLDFGFRPVPVDFGDSPDTYGTTGALAASHTITPGLYLGECVDAELDGQPNPNADGDDSNAGYYTVGTCATPGDDEDGVQLVTPLVPGAQACVQVTAVNTTGSDAYLYAWFDWNGDGAFNATELVDTGDFAGGSVTIPNGGVTDQVYCFDVPATATFNGGEAFMRFRLTTDALTGTDFSGPATDGEVEDNYEPLYCAGNFVWNDGGSATWAVQDGTEPGLSGVTVTLLWDGDDNGSFTDPADRAYTTATDANGFYTFCGLVADATRDGAPDAYRLDVSPPSGLTLVDPNQGTDEALDSDADPATGQGPVFTLPVTPDTDTAGNDADPNAYPDARTHLAVDFGFVAYDFGDLPAPYATTLADNGPRHLILPTGNPTLGSTVDPERDALPDPDALGDDNQNTDDEDGVTLPALFVAGHTYTIPCTLTNATASTVVSAWFDWNGDGDFNDPGEQVLDNASAAAGCPAVTVTVPLDVAPQVGIRYRVADQPIPGPEGTVLSGEVEDYRVAAQPTYDFGDAPDSFLTLEASGGPKHRLTTSLYLGECVDGDNDGQPDAFAGTTGTGGDDAADASDTTDVEVGSCASGDDEDGITLLTPLLPGAQACISVTAYNATGGDAYLYAWVDWDGNAAFSEDEWVNTGDFSTGRALIPDGGVRDQRLCFQVPADATFDGGEVHMRFRLTTDTLQASDWGGVASDGEVEDYWDPLACVGNFVWNDTGSAQINAQEASDAPVTGLDLYLVWAGPNGIFETTAGDTTAQGDDLLIRTTTDAQGRYAFCGLTGSSAPYRIHIPSPPAGLNQTVVPDATADTQDSDAQQPGGPGTPVLGPTFSLSRADLIAGNLPTGENGNQDAATQTDPALTFNYPDGRTDLTIDFGFRTVNGTATKRLVTTDQTFTASTDVAIGEILTYETTLTLSPGTVLNLTLTDVLDRGLAFVACESITATGALTASAGPWDAICANPTVEPEPTTSTEPVDQGRRITWSFGTVTNSGLEDATITVRYRVVVLNSAGNTQGQRLENQVTWTWDAGTALAQADSVTIVEPNLEITKDASPRVVLPAEPVTFTITVRHAADSQADAFDVVVQDQLPEDLDIDPTTLQVVSGPAPTTLSYDDATRTITAVWDVLPLGSQVTLRFQATVTDIPTRTTNVATVAWTSLPCDDCQDPYALSAFNPLATERFYDPPSDVDIYGDTAEVEILGVLPDTGFAPGRITPLPPQPEDLIYRETDLVLEIPKLGVEIPIVGVPRTEKGWEITWLMDRAGWLEGTAFPTWEGNTAITAHAYLPSGLPGPFQALGQLQWGDRILIHAYGATYVYEVRNIAVVEPWDTSPLAPKEQDWLTLITCVEYDATQDRFQYRLIVQAVLVEVVSSR